MSATLQSSETPKTIVVEKSRKRVRTGPSIAELREELKDLHMAGTLTATTKLKNDKTAGEFLLDQWVARMKKPQPPSVDEQS